MRAHGRRLIFAAGIVAALLRAPGAPAQTTTTTTVPAATPGKCLAARLKAIGKEEKARLGCVAKAVAKNDTSSLADCQAKAAQKLEGAFAKATGCDGTASGCGALADLCIGGVSAALPDTGPSRCEAARLQAAGKKAAAQLGCHAKAALHGVAVDGDCLDRAAAKFSTAFGKVTVCSGDETAVEKEVDAECVGQLLALSGGVVTGLCPSLVAVRPYQSVVPSSYVPGTPTPL